MKKFLIFMCFLPPIYYLLDGDKDTYKEVPIAIQDSIITTKVDSFSTLFSNRMDSISHKFTLMARTLKRLKTKPFDRTQHIQIESMACGGYSDSCRYNPSNLANVLTISELVRDTTYQQFGYLGDPTVLDLLRMHQNLFLGDYKPASMSFEDHVFSSVLEEMDEDFYNVKGIWDAHWYLILAVDEYTAPSSKYGGGSLKGKWHVFDFNNVEYIGSINIEAENTEGFDPEQIQTTIAKNRRLTISISGGGVLIPSIETVTTETTTYHSEENQFRQAGFDLHKNFKKACEKAINANFFNSKGENGSYYY